MVTQPKAIVIAAYVEGGFGDILFALKLAALLKKNYEVAGKIVPPIYVAFKPDAAKTAIKLGANTEFGVDVLTIADLATINVGTLIVGPIVAKFFLDEIARNLSPMENEEELIQLILAPEYAWMYSVDLKEDHLGSEHYAKTNFRRFRDVKTVYSGFNGAEGEGGILLTEALAEKASDEVLVNQLDEKIRDSILLGKPDDMAGYKATTDLSMQYSRDDQPSDQTSPEQFLKVHREFYKDSSKDQDVVMLGKKEDTKKSALKAVLDQLIADGFTKITFYNAETGENTIFYDSQSPGKTYRVLYQPSMTHPSVIACNALSGPLIGATGDQSLGEALSGNKITVYENNGWKRALIEDYDTAIKKKSNNDPDICTTLDLLRRAKTPSEYEQLGLLLRNETIQKKLATLNATLMKEYDLISKFVEAMGPRQNMTPSEGELRDEIYRLLLANEFKKAMELIHDCKDRFSFTDTRLGSQFIDRVQEPEYYRLQIARLLELGNQDEALKIIQGLNDILTMDDKHEGKSLIQYAIDNDPQGSFVKHYNLQKFKDGMQAIRTSSLPTQPTNSDVAFVIEQLQMLAKNKDTSPKHKEYLKNHIKYFETKRHDLQYNREDILADLKKKPTPTGGVIKRNLFSKSSTYKDIIETQVAQTLIDEGEEPSNSSKPD